MWGRWRWIRRAEIPEKKIRAARMEPWTASGHPWKSKRSRPRCVQLVDERFQNSHNNGSPLRLVSHHKKQARKKATERKNRRRRRRCFNTSPRSHVNIYRGGRAVMRWTFLLHLFVSTLFYFIYWFLTVAGFFSRPKRPRWSPMMMHRLCFDRLLWVAQGLLMRLEEGETGFGTSLMIVSSKRVMTRRMALTLGC